MDLKRIETDPRVLGILYANFHTERIVVIGTSSFMISDISRERFPKTDLVFMVEDGILELFSTPPAINAVEVQRLSKVMSAIQSAVTLG